MIDLIGEDSGETKNNGETKPYIPMNIPVVNEQQWGDQPNPQDEVGNPVEFQTYIVTPHVVGSKNLDLSWITKEMAVTYLTPEDMKKVRLLGNMIGRCRQYGYDRLADRYITQLSIILVSSRSREGFERQIGQTSITKQFQTIDGTASEGAQPRKKLFGIF
jgi:hypothetical protein